MTDSKVSIIVSHRDKKMNTQESKERKFEEKAREKGWVALTFI